MHIVFLTHEYPKKDMNGGGIGSFVQFLSRELIKENIRVSIVGLNNNNTYEESEDFGVNIYRVAKSKWLFGKFFQHTKRILSKIDELSKIEEVDIVEGSELNFAFFPKKTAYKKVIRLHGGHHFFALELDKKTAFWRSYQEKKSFNKADAYIAVSTYVGKQTQKYLNINFPFTTIYNSVDTNKFKPNPKIQIKENSLLFVGTVCEKKGVKQLIETIPIIKRDYPKIKLNIVGRDWNFKDGSSYINYLKKNVIKDNFKANINFIGAVPHEKITEYLNTAAICVFPSHMEAMPIAWLEALAMGKIVVASNIGPGNEAIKNYETGVLIDPYSPNEIADAIMELLETNKTHLGKNARKDVLERFNVDSIKSQNIEFYKSLLK
jgi:glycosyltransferase involved in cell wall biosynthesis